MITESQMAVKLLYSMDSDNTTQFVAKPPAPFKVSVHADFGIGFCRLDKCLDYMVSNCSEFNHGEFSVFSADFSEENAPLLSHGRLSQLTKSVETVSGTIKQNLLAQQIFEVQLYFKKCEEPKRVEENKRAHSQHSLPRRLPPSSPPAAKRHHTAPRDDFISNSFNPLDSSNMRQIYVPRKRANVQKEKDSLTPRITVPRCKNCEIFESTVWRWGVGGEVLCNPCGLWPRTHVGQMRPEKCWKKKRETYPERWRAQLYRRDPGDEPFALYKLSEEEIRNARTDPPYIKVENPREEPSPNVPSTPEPERVSSPELPSTPVSSSRQPTEQDKENVPPAPSTPVRPPPLDIVGNDSHHKWMRQFIEGSNDEHDLFEAFMRSPSKQPTRHMDFEISSALSSSPPSSSSNVFDVSEQDLASIGTDWIFKTPEKNASWAHSLINIKAED